MCQKLTQVHKPQDDDFGLRMKNRDAERRWSMGMSVDGVRGSGNNVALYSSGKSPHALHVRKEEGTLDPVRINKYDFTDKPAVSARKRRTTVAGTHQKAIFIQARQGLCRQCTECIINRLRK